MPHSFLWPRERFMALVSREDPIKADVIFLAEGDGHCRAAHAAALYFDDYAPLIVTVGGDARREYGSFLSGELKERLLELGVPDAAVYAEETAAHTKAEADRMMELARERGWKSMLLVTSPHHQYRAFLTFLRAMHQAGLDLVLRNTPAPLPWFSDQPWGRRADLLERELQQIAAYQEKGDVASYEEGIAYLERRDLHPDPPRNL
jgi:uncharacterized SAM-binding protein YcdF (DUF218 family)